MISVRRLTPGRSAWAMSVRALPTALIAGLLCVPSANAQEPGARTEVINTYLDYVSEGWRDTPEEWGFLPTALAEATLAARYAKVAEEAEDLATIQENARLVLAAINPAQAGVSGGRHGAEAGDSAGQQRYGVWKGTLGVAQFTNLAAKTAGASLAVTTHSLPVTAATDNTLVRAQKIIDLAQAIEGAATTDEAKEDVEMLSALTQQLIYGAGSIGDVEQQGGLEQAEHHLMLMRRAEGLPVSR